MTDMPPGSHLVQVGTGPLFYLPLTKTGSTQVLELAHRLEFGEDAVTGSDAVHRQSRHLPRGTHLVPGALPAGILIFSFARPPLDRFLSLYFDKIWNPGHPDPHPMMARFAELVGTRTDPGLSAAEHLDNCHRALDRIERSLTPGSDWQMNPHWAPQIRRFRLVDGLPLRLATLSGLNAKVMALLTDIDRQRAGDWAQGRANASRRAQVRIDTDALAPRVNRIYAKDWALWQALARADAADPGAVFHDFGALCRDAGL